MGVSQQKQSMDAIDPSPFQRDGSGLEVVMSKNNHMCTQVEAARCNPFGTSGTSRHDERLSHCVRAVSASLGLCKWISSTGFGVSRKLVKARWCCYG
jgi:hypothetical protein